MRASRDNRPRQAIPTRRVPLVPLALAVVALAGGLGCGERSDDPHLEPSPQESTNTEVAYSFDPTDKRKLVTFAHNVFVGRVARQSGQFTSRTSDGNTEVPQSRFAVFVEKNIKGHLRGVVTVDQFGGPVLRRRAKADVRRELQLWEGDPLLKPGEVALFATRGNPARGSHTIVAQPFADRRIRTPADGDRVVREFEQAYRKKRSR